MLFGHKVLINFVIFFHFVNLVGFCLSSINRIGVLCALFDTLQPLSTWSEDVHMVWI